MAAARSTRGRIHRRRTIYRGRVFTLTRETVRLGGREVVRETIRHPGAVVIVPILDPSTPPARSVSLRETKRHRGGRSVIRLRSRIVFVRQYRHAVGRELFELPAGTLEAGESPVACARRELSEETGWRPGRLRKLGVFYVAPGYCTEEITVFLARGLRRGNAHPEPDELLRPVVFTLRDALARIRSGVICDAKSIIGVQAAQRFLA